MAQEFYFYIFIIMGAIACIMGILILTQSVKFYQVAIKSNNWPSTFGNVLSKTIVERELPGLVKRIVYNIRVLYEYEVDGTKYTGDQKNIGNLTRNFRNKVSAEKELDKIELNSEIEVFYNPLSQKTSTLSRGVSKVHVNQFLFGFIFLFLGILIITLMASAYF